MECQRKSNPARHAMLCRHKHSAALQLPAKTMDNIMCLLFGTGTSNTIKATPEPSNASPPVARAPNTHPQYWEDAASRLGRQQRTWRPQCPETCGRLGRQERFRIMRLFTFPTPDSVSYSFKFLSKNIDKSCPNVRQASSCPWESWSSCTFASFCHAPRQQGSWNGCSSGPPALS